MIESSRVARRRALVRARILDVAAQKFAERGVADTTLDDIGEAADVARGTLYTHFDSKEELARAVVAPVLRALAEGAAAFPKKKPEAAAKALLKLYVDVHAAHPHALSVAFRMQQIMESELGKLHDAFAHATVRVFEEAQAAGVLRTGDAKLAARTLGRVGIPLLELYAPRADPLWLEAMHALLFKERAAKRARPKNVARARPSSRL